MRLEKNLKVNPIQEKLKNLVVTFKEAMPIVTALRNDKLTETHWAEIKNHVQKDFDINTPDFTLKSLIDLDVNQFAEDITAISTQATQEANLRTQLAELKEKWAKIQFSVEFDDKCDSYLLKEVDEVYAELDESLAQINMILGSRFVKPLRNEADTFKKNMMTLNDMLDEWMSCQKNWRYLENIFKAKDIKTALAEEWKKFDQVDRSFKGLMKNTKTKNKCLKIVQGSPQILDTLKTNNKTLDDVQKKLDDYMEMKRNDFPRFYFLSNDELIDILANSQEFDIVQQHLKTCFDNVVKVDFIENDEIDHINSSEKEKVELKKPAKTRGGVEQWLLGLEQAVKDTLQLYMKNGF